MSKPTLTPEGIRAVYAADDAAVLERDWRNALFESLDELIEQTFVQLTHDMPGLHVDHYQRIREHFDNLKARLRAKEP